MAQMEEKEFDLDEYERKMAKLLDGVTRPSQVAKECLVKDCNTYRLPVDPATMCLVDPTGNDDLKNLYGVSRKFFYVKEAFSTVMEYCQVKCAAYCAEDKNYLKKVLIFVRGCVDSTEYKDVVKNPSGEDEGFQLASVVGDDTVTLDFLLFAMLTATEINHANFLVYANAMVYPETLKFESYVLLYNLRVFSPFVGNQSNLLRNKGALDICTTFLRYFDCLDHLFNPSNGLTANELYDAHQFWKVLCRRCGYPDGRGLHILDFCRMIYEHAVNYGALFENVPSSIAAHVFNRINTNRFHLTTKFLVLDLFINRELYVVNRQVMTSSQHTFYPRLLQFECDVGRLQMKDALPGKKIVMLQVGHGHLLPLPHESKRPNKNFFNELPASKKYHIRPQLNEEDISQLYRLDYSDDHRKSPTPSVADTEEMEYSPRDHAPPPVIQPLPSHPPSLPLPLTPRRILSQKNVIWGLDRVPLSTNDFPNYLMNRYTRAKSYKHLVMVDADFYTTPLADREVLREMDDTHGDPETDLITSFTEADLVRRATRTVIDNCVSFEDCLEHFPVSQRSNPVHGTHRVVFPVDYTDLVTNVMIPLVMKIQFVFRNNWLCGALRSVEVSAVLDAMITNGICYHFPYFSKAFLMHRVNDTQVNRTLQSLRDLDAIPNSPRGLKENPSVETVKALAGQADSNFLALVSVEQDAGLDLRALFTRLRDDDNSNAAVTRHIKGIVCSFALQMMYALYCLHSLVGVQHGYALVSNWVVERLRGDDEEQAKAYRIWNKFPRDHGVPSHHFQCGVMFLRLVDFGTVMPLGSIPDPEKTFRFVDEVNTAFRSLLKMLLELQFGHHEAKAILDPILFNMQGYAQESVESAYKRLIGDFYGLEACVINQEVDRDQPHICNVYQNSPETLKKIRQFARTLSPALAWADRRNYFPESVQAELSENGDYDYDYDSDDDEKKE